MVGPMGAQVVGYVDMVMASLDLMRNHTSRVHMSFKYCSYEYLKFNNIATYIHVLHSKLHSLPYRHLGNLWMILISTLIPCTLMYHCLSVLAEYLEVPASKPEWLTKVPKTPDSLVPVTEQESQE